jgi:hypothetical protein
VSGISDGERNRLLLVLFIGVLMAALAMLVTAGVMLALLVVGIWLRPRMQTAPESAAA